MRLTALVTTALIALLLASVGTALAHKDREHFTREAVCEVVGESGHRKKSNGKTKFWAVTLEVVSPFSSDCIAVRACLYWSWDSGYQSWDGKCANSFRGGASVEAVKKLWTRYSEHAAKGPTNDKYEVLGVIYH